jgi:23S rRNA (cytidine1920-2'-O)/16S rRNA (cytidine1409-2'-O)-methyltransferase
MRIEGTSRNRLDDAVVERGLVPTRSKARAMILAGDVTVNGVANVRAGATVRTTDEIALRAKPRFVSRGGEKLAHALAEFEVDVTDRVCADLGASTGGFTDCLLQSGASRVYAVDVGYGQFDARLRDDDRVVVMERTNARYLEELPEPVSIVTIDVSFISLELILPVAWRLLDDGGCCIALIKPQFEAGKGQVGDRGVVRDPMVHQSVIEKILTSAQLNSFCVQGLTRSPLRGPEGNIEFLVSLQKVQSGDQCDPTDDIGPLISSVMDQSPT